MSTTSGQGGGPGRERVVFFIDREKFTVEGRALTARIILVEYAREDPAVTVLARIEGATQTKLEDLDAPLAVKDGTKFTVYHTGPTTVS